MIQSPDPVWSDGQDSAAAPGTDSYVCLNAGNDIRQEKRQSRQKRYEQDVKSYGR